MRWNTQHDRLSVHLSLNHDDIMTWKHFPHYWLLWGESTEYWWINFTKFCDVESTGFFVLIVWTSCGTNSPAAGDLRCHEPHVMSQWWTKQAVTVPIISSVCPCNICSTPLWLRCVDDKSPPNHYERYTVPWCIKSLRPSDAYIH